MRRSGQKGVPDPQRNKKGRKENHFRSGLPVGWGNKEPSPRHNTEQKNAKIFRLNWGETERGSEAAKRSLYAPAETQAYYRAIVQEWGETSLRKRFVYNNGHHWRGEGKNKFPFTNPKGVRGSFGSGEGWKIRRSF